MFFLKNLKFLQNNMKLSDFSKITKISYRTLQDIFARESNNPKADTLIKLKEAFNISIDDILLKDLEKEDNKK